MCHREALPEETPFTGSRAEVAVPLAGGESMPAFLATPSGEADGSVLVVHDVFGRSAFYEGLACRLATAGFEALLPDFFFRQGPPADDSREAALARRAGLDETGALDDLAAALAWLRGRPSHTGRVGTLGFCMGGTFALDLTAREDDLVTVSYYGFPVPQATLVSPPPRPLDLVPEMRGPILALWGENDASVGLDNVDAFVRRCDEAGVDLEHRVYPGLGHGFLKPSPEAGEKAERLARESWELTLRHLERHVRRPAA